MSWRLPAVAAAAAVLGVSSVAALTMRGEEDAFVGGPGLDIALFTPEPRPIEAGGVMEVGELVNGYVHRPRAPRDDGMDPYLAAWLPEEDYPAYREDFEPIRDERPYAREPEPAPPPEEFEPTDRRERNAWSFGFDEPRPDYAAARRERRERIEALERRVAEMRPEGGVYPATPDLRPSETFY